MLQEVMGGDLFTVDDLAKRWKFDRGKIYSLVRERKLKPCPGFPSYRFRPDEVFKFEGGTGDPLSPFERKRLEAIIKDQDARIKMLEKKLHKIVTVCYEMQEEES